MKAIGNECELPRLSNVIEASHKFRPGPRGLSVDNERHEQQRAFMADVFAGLRPGERK